MAGQLHSPAQFCSKSQAEAFDSGDAKTNTTRDYRRSLHSLRRLDTRLAQALTRHRCQTQRSAAALPRD